MKIPKAKKSAFVVFIYSRSASDYKILDYEPKLYKVEKDAWTVGHNAPKEMTFSAGFNLLKAEPLDIQLCQGAFTECDG